MGKANPLEKLIGEFTDDKRVAENDLRAVYDFDGYYKERKTSDGKWRIGPCGDIIPF